MHTYSLVLHRERNSLIYALEADALIICQCEIEEASEPAGKFGDICSSLACS
jgi:hypothetical protein